MRLRLAALLFLLLPSCGPKETGDHTDCVAPGGCSAVRSTLGTGEAQVDLLADGTGCVYAALLGRGKGGTYCPANTVCHGELWRVDATGEVVWKVGERKSVDRPILIRGGVAYRTGDGRIAAVSTAGTPLWTVETGDPLVVASAWAADVYVVGGGSARRVDARTGTVVWDVPFAGTYNAPAAPGPWPDRVVISGLVSASIVARGLDYIDGSTEWEATLSGGSSAPAIVSREPAAPLPDRGPTMIVADRISLRTREGAEVWGYDAFEGFRFVVPTVNDGWIALGPLSNVITRFRPNGTVLWSGPATAPVVWLSATPDGQLLVGQNDGRVRKLNEGTGNVLWEYGGVDTVKAPAAPLYRANGNIVFFGANTGEESDPNLTTITPAGQTLERWNAGARVSSIALSGSGDVFIAVSDGRLYLRRAADL